MSSFNQVTLMGYLGKDPEIFAAVDKPPFAKVQIATNKSWKKEGIPFSRTDWHTVIFRRRLAEIVHEHLHVGDRILVTGELASKIWLDKDGKKRTSVFIEAKEFKFLTPKPRQETEEDDEEVTTVATDESEHEEDIPM